LPTPGDPVTAIFAVKRQPLALAAFWPVCRIWSWPQDCLSCFF
jgi:hypothetical protein